jgi:hypothetical protein
MALDSFEVPEFDPGELDPEFTLDEVLFDEVA